MAKTLRILTDPDFTTKGATLTFEELDQTLIDIWDATLDGKGVTATAAELNRLDGTLATVRQNLGLEIGVDVQAWDADLDTYSANPLTASELGELQNINSVTISNTQWGYLGAMDQGVSTTDDVLFPTVTIGAVGSRRPELSNSRTAAPDSLTLRPATGNNVGSLELYPSGTNARTHFVIANDSDFNNNGAIKLELDGDQGSLWAYTKGTGGTLPTHFIFRNFADGTRFEDPVTIGDNVAPTGELDVYRTNTSNRIIANLIGQGNTASSYSVTLTRGRANGDPLVDNDFGVGLQWVFVNDASSDVIGSRILPRITDVSSGSEDMLIEWRQRVNGSEQVVLSLDQGDVTISGLLDAETVQTQTLRTTLFKPTTINGLGGEFAFSAVSTVVSIDTGANTIVVEDAVFSNGDSVVVSSAIYNQSGFSNVELNITSAGSAVSGGTEYSYTVNSGVDTDIDTGDSVTRVDGDLVYINATEGSESPRIAGYDNLTGFSDSPLSGDTATAVWELNATGGVIGGYNIDSTHLWTEDGAQTAGTFSGMIQQQSSSTKVFFSGADDKDGLNSTFHVFPDGRIFSDAAADSIWSRTELAAFTQDANVSTISDQEWHQNIARSSNGMSFDESTKIQTIRRKRFSKDTITLTGVGRRESTSGGGSAIVERLVEIRFNVFEVNGAATASGSTEIAFASDTVFSADVDISSIPDGALMLIEVSIYVEIDITNYDSGTYETDGFLREDLIIETSTG